MTARPAILLVHSPLVGPSTWEPTADLLRTRGFEVGLPDLTPAAAAPPPLWRAFVDAALEGAAGLAGPIALLGHSGAGAFLPAIAAGLGARLFGLLFVDAVLPPTSGEFRTPEERKAKLDELTVDGCLLRWLDWWPPGVVEELLPDPAERAAVLADMPVLPRSFYDEAVPVPDGWAEQRCGYLRLSEGYVDEHGEAGRRDWYRAEFDGDHLAIRSDPATVADAAAAFLAAT